SAWRLAAAKSFMAQRLCRAAPGSFIAPTHRALYLRCSTGASAKPPDILFQAHRAIAWTSRAAEGLAELELPVIRYRLSHHCRLTAVAQLGPLGRQSEVPDLAPRPIAN